MKVDKQFNPQKYERKREQQQSKPPSFASQAPQSVKIENQASKKTKEAEKQVGKRRDAKDFMSSSNESDSEVKVHSEGEKSKRVGISTILNKKRQKTEADQRASEELPAKEI
mmetsp:Transcript_14083/g.23919  ORF Transcript_14083/g.23919 Transcript_14083/m.23919 type:complete len:112 (+) Transcript_14083:418-753(+)|eukprot:CAMPEP_0168608824 /NCGR_PEP_ID=MMETSP0449_2-20121227/861_1 /TAXON_ID=1082188 /ORGANISM="Strombidium rassoulzadegani, Strain ras09" /LENGTH=111 /DNA_ID=CAMNT_0008648891 /DNA_START=321 /DNA_END=656 /DNA_ORIENTATION=-